LKQQIVSIAIVVADYDEAIDFYVNKLQFQLIEDTPLSPEKRWVLVAPPGSDGTCLLLAKASTEEQKSRVGNQTGGRVFLFCTLMTSGEIIIEWKKKASSLYALLNRSHMVQ
jgi:catechol 2,3-dioxygenase-like lactoylglutathione lyase family enzyme